MSFLTYNRRGHGCRRGEFITGALTIVGIITLAAAAYFGKQNSDMEREALSQTREVAEVAENRKMKSADNLAEVAEREAKELQVNQVGRSIQIISAVGGPITDLVDLSMDADDATQYYANQLYGPNANEAQMAIIQQKAAALSKEIKSISPGLEDNKKLVSYTLRRMMDQEKSTSNPKVLEGLRKQFPNKYGKMSNEEMRTALVRSVMLGPIHVAKRCYEQAWKELSQDGAEPSPEQMNDILTALFNDTRDGLNEKAFKAALATVMAVKNAKGTYSGKFSGSASGSCRIIIDITGVTGSFTGSGALTGGDGTFTVTVSGNGPCDPATGIFSGDLSGKLSYLSTIGPGVTNVKGSFKGKVGAKGVNGTWSANALGETRTGTFNASK